MKIQDEFSISVEGYRVRIDAEVTQSIIPTQDGRPRWKLHYDELGKGAIDVMETVREELEELDEEDYLPVGTAGFAVGDLFLEHDQDGGLRVKADNEELLGELSEDQLRELLKDDV
jgi:hypothetical protein